MLSAIEHHYIFKFIDYKIGYIFAFDDNMIYQNIMFDNETTKTAYVKKVNFATHLENGLIAIHRDDLAKPNTSYLKEVIFLLHEFGHSQLYNKSLKKSIVGLDYNKGLNKQKFKTLIEEAAASLIGIISIWHLPLSMKKKILLFPAMFLSTSLSWLKYLNWSLYV
jgi:hypothetical protein